MINDCECSNWAAEWFWDHKGHHPNCSKYNAKTDREFVGHLLRDLYSVMNEWGSEEDGIPEFVWPVYKRLCEILFVPVYDSEQL